MTLIRRPGAIGVFALSLSAVMMGIIARRGAVAFPALIAMNHNLIFLGHFSFAYDANEFIAPPPGAHR